LTTNVRSSLMFNTLLDYSFNSGSHSDITQVFRSNSHPANSASLPFCVLASNQPKLLYHRERQQDARANGPYVPWHQISIVRQAISKTMT